MKTIQNIKFPAVIIALFFTLNLMAQSPAYTVQTDTFKVSGNCESCKKRIEKAALKVKGVKTAVWSETTQELNVSYDTAATTLTKIGEEIAKTGHDNKYATATPAAYGKLPACCKYTRAK